MKSKVIALSAISSGFIAIFLTLGAYLEFIDVITVMLASIFVILPSYYNSRLGSFLTFLVGGLIGFMFSGFNIMSLVFPTYFLLMGLMPVMNQVVEKTKLNKKIWYAIKFVWTLIALYILLWYYTQIMNIPLEYSFELFGNLYDFSATENILAYFLIAYGIIGVIFFVVYDRFLVVAKIYTSKLLKKILK